MSYILTGIPTITLPKSANNPFVIELLSSYTYGKTWDVEFSDVENVITLGSCTKAARGNSESVLNVTDKGVYIEGADFPSVMRGFVSFLERIHYSQENDSFYIESILLKEKLLMKFRSVHLCFFPETDIEFFKKCVRSCSVAKFTHIVVEFWGMLKLDCMKELSWPFAHTKDTIRKIVAEANAMGVEIIPMFNHLGHASSCREINGKHVILDQNPRYEYMFESYGWIWNIRREDVRSLLKEIRHELIEVCGKGSYFHIGCDEAYAVANDESRVGEFADYLNETVADLRKCGRRAIMWHDLLLSKEENKGYIASSSKKVADALAQKLDKSVILADWQYGVHDEAWETSRKLKDAGFDVVCCPWDRSGTINIDEAIKTVSDNNLFGILHTTWHSLYEGFRMMIYAGAASYGTDDKTGDIARFYAAHVVRHVMPSNGVFKKSGWSEDMTGPGLL